jgi:hypothetical protein
VCIATDQAAAAGGGGYDASIAITVSAFRLNQHENRPEAVPGLAESAIERPLSKHQQNYRRHHLSVANDPHRSSESCQGHIAGPVVVVVVIDRVFDRLASAEDASGQSASQAGGDARWAVARSRGVREISNEIARRHSRPHLPC